MADAMEFDFIGKDDVSNVLREIAGQMDGVTAAIDGVERSATSVDSAFADMSRMVSDAAKVFVDLRDTMDVVDAATSAVTANMQGMQATFGELAADVASGASAFGDFADMQRMTADQAQALDDTIKAQADTLAALGAAAMDGITAIDGMSEAEQKAAGDTTLLRSALADVVVSTDDALHAFESMTAIGRVTDQTMQELANVMKATADATTLAGDAAATALGQRMATAALAAAKAMETMRAATLTDTQAADENAAAHEKLAAAADQTAAAATKKGAALQEEALANTGDQAAAERNTVAHQGFFGTIAGGLNHLANNALELGINAALLDQFGLHTIQTGLDYQKWMAIIKSLTGSAGMSIQDISNTLLANAPAWRQTPAALAEALYYVRSASFVGKDGMDILKASSMAAIGGLGSVVDIAKAVTTMLVDYGLHGDQAAKTTELFLNGVVAGKSNIEEFANALGKVMPTASAMHISMDGVITALAAMTHTGLSAAVSGTYLRSIITRLEGQFTAVKSAAAGYNITLDEVKWAHMSQEGPMALIDQLHYLWVQAHDSAAKYSKDPAVIEQRTTDAFSKMVGGIRSGSGAYALLANAAKNYNYALGIVDGQHGTLAQHFKDMSDTIGGAWLGLKASLATLWTQMVITFGPQIAGLLNNLGGAVQRLTSFMTTHQGVMRAVAGAAIALFAAFNIAAIGGVLALALRFTGILPLFGLLTGHMGEAGALARIFGGEAGGIGRALAPLGGLLRGTGEAGRALGSALLNPITLLRNIGGAITGVFTAIGSGAADGLEALSNGFFRLATMAIRIPNPLMLLRTGLTSLLPALGSIVGAALPVIGIFLLIAGIIAIVALAFFKFRSQTMAALQPLLTEVRGVFMAIAGMIMVAVKQIQATWQSVWPQIRPAMLEFLAAVKQMGPVWQVLGTVIKIAAAIIIGAIAGLVNGFLHALPMIIGVFTGIVQVITGVFQIIKGLFTFNGTLIQQGFGNIFGGLLKIVTSALGAVLNFIGGFVSGVFGWFNMLSGGRISAIFQQLVLSILQALSHLPLVGTIFGAAARQMEASMNEAKAKTTQSALQMKEGVIAHARDMHMKAAAEAMMQARKLIDQANHTTDATVKAALLKKAGVLEHTAQEQTRAAQLAAMQQAEVALQARRAADQAKASAADAKLGVVGHFAQMERQTAAQVQQMASSIWSSIQGGMARFGAAVQSGIASVLGFFGSLPGKAVAAMSSLGSQLAGVASNAMTSMEGAITAAIGRLAAAAGNAVGGIIAGAKKALGIASPSTVFLEIGTHTMLGLANGILAGGTHATTAMETTTGQLIATARKGVVTAQRQALTAGQGTGVAATGGASGGGAAAAGAGGATIHLHLDGGLGAGLQLLNPSDRRRFAQQVAKELSLDTGLQGIQPLGYSGRGTI